MVYGGFLLSTPVKQVTALLPQYIWNRAFNASQNAIRTTGSTTTPQADTARTSQTILNLCFDPATNRLDLRG